MSTQYYITSYRHSEQGYWQPAKSTTLTKAKRECTREFGAGYIDATLKVGVMVRGQIELVAAKSNRAGATWVNHI